MRATQIVSRLLETEPADELDTKQYSATTLFPEQIAQEFGYQEDSTGRWFKWFALPETGAYANGVLVNVQVRRYAIQVSVTLGHREATETAGVQIGNWTHVNHYQAYHMETIGPHFRKALQLIERLLQIGRAHV